VNIEIEIDKPGQWERDDLEDVSQEVALANLEALAANAPSTMVFIRNERLKLLIAVDGAKFFAGLDDFERVYSLERTDVESPDAEVEIMVGGQVAGLPRRQIVDVDVIRRVVAWFYDDGADDLAGLRWA
jgi:hypothetical protein